MSRPEETKKESIMSVAQAVIWAFSTYGIPRGVASGTRPRNTRLETIRSVADTVLWAWTS